jgi:hypothetical protein
MRRCPVAPCAPLFLFRVLFRVRVLVLGAACLGFAAPPGLAQTRPFGPLTTEEASPLQRVGFTHASEGADPVEARAFRMDLWMGYSNIFEQDSSEAYEMFLDAERLYSTATLRWGAARNVELGARLSLETTGGGVLDGFLSTWHRRLRVGNANRGFYPTGQYAQTLRDGSGTLSLDVPQRTLALEDLRVFAKWRRWSSRDGSRVASLRGVVRIPTGDNRVGRRRTDVALMALGRRSWTRWHAHGTLGASTARAANDYGGLLRTSSAFMDLALERNLNPGLSAVAQLSMATPALQGFGDPELDGWPVNLVLGLAGRLKEGWGFDVSLQEDIPTDTPAVDFTLGIGVRRSW